ncbi:MAG: class-II fumarase/aspartase family protein [Chloroflexota bacterium]
MASTMIESALLGGTFSDDRIRQIFSDEALVEKLLRVEAALARAESQVGLIPTEAAEEIDRKAVPQNFSLDALREGYERLGQIMVPLVQALAESCEGEAGGYVHWGATTQDIYDTAFVLRYRDAFEYVLDYLIKIREALAVLAEREADTLIAGRTHAQHALPCTFGYKVAVWFWEIHRQLERWKQATPRVLVGNLTGAVGTMAGFEGKGPEVQRLAMEELGLGSPEICWHTSRDRSAEIASLITLTAGTLERIANEVYRLQSTEIGELAEPTFEGKIGSSTMPHKRNPHLCEMIIASSRGARAEASVVFGAMAQEHERHMGLWRSEWVGLPNAFMLLGGALSKTQHIVAGLEVDRKRMRANLDLSDGAILSESIMLELGRFVGRQRAHDIVYHASMRSAKEGRSLRECLGESEEVMAHLSSAELDRLFDYRSYIGHAPDLARGPMAFIGNADR